MVGVVKWLALLDGHDFDLQDLPHHFDEDPQVHDADGYWLDSASFDGLADVAEVQETARAMVARMNGAMRLHDPGYQPVRLAGRYRNENGDHVVLQVGSALEREKATMVVVVGGASAPRPTGPRDYDRLGAADAAGADLLLIFSRGDLDWYDLFKVFEIVRAESGGERAIVAMGWATKNNISAFRVPANHPGVSGDAARHARQQPVIPKHTMTLGEGRLFITDLAQSWLKSRLDGQ
jgi:hypothetical protein